MTIFVGRQPELDLLDRLWGSKKAELLLLYGRRRVGKSRLLAHWQEKSGCDRILFWVAEPTSSTDQLRRFSQALYLFERNETAPNKFIYDDWGQAFRAIAKIAEKERVAVFLDEFTYLLELEVGIAAKLQHAWDQELKNSDLLLVISGSHIGMMNKHILNDQAPLYGRATSQLNLLPLPFGATSKYFPKYKPHERVALYSMLGGIPAYWEKFDPDLSVSDNIRFQFLAPGSVLKDEPILLLQDFLQDTHNYVGILRAIAHGDRTISNISTFTGIDRTAIPSFMKALIATDFVARRVPVTTKETSRLGNYYITDPWLRFYYRFLFGKQGNLSRGAQNQAIEEIKKYLIDFIGTHTWEELCQEWLLLASDNNGVPYTLNEIGSFWNANAQIDVVGMNSMTRTLVLGECKWGTKAVGKGVLDGLIAKTPEAVPAGKDGWNVHYLGFARAGWSKEAIDFAKNFSPGNYKGEKWKAASIQLLHLEDVDKQLAQWSDW